MADFTPPPTYAEVVLVDDITGKGLFNPIWLKWFLDLVEVLNASGGGGGGSFVHNDLTGLQGGSAAERYHSTNAENATLVALAALANGIVEKTSATVFAARAVATYTPTLTAVANVAASTAFLTTYMRLGAWVHVFGKADIDPTAAGSTQLGISLPVASNIGAAEDCCGVAFCPTIAGQGAAILGDAANNRAQMEWIAVDVTNQPMYFNFAYRII